jgi:hypothetical protein
MVQSAQACDRSRVAQLLIRFRRPASVPESEVRAWIERRARGRYPVLGRARLGGSESEAWVLGVKLPGDVHRAAEERLSDLIIESGGAGA